MSEEHAPVLAAHQLVKHYRARTPHRGSVVHALDQVDLVVEPRETHALVGESGCGKSTLAHVLLRLVAPTSGRVELLGRDFLSLRGEALRLARRSIQLVFQDPYTSLDPRMTIGAIVAEPFVAHRIATTAARAVRVRELLDRVGLDSVDAGWYPHQLSGGQRQRVALARAVALEPAVVVCDEPVSSLDVSVQAQVLALLRRLQEESGIAYLFISHDLAVVNQIAQRVSVMYLGKIVEHGPRDAVLRDSAHPYTMALVRAAESRCGRTDDVAGVVRGEPPSATRPPSGCRFRTRCPKAADRCALEEPELQEVSEGHFVACHFPEFISLTPLQ